MREDIATNLALALLYDPDVGLHAVLEGGTQVRKSFAGTRVRRRALT